MIREARFILPAFLPDGQQSAHHVVSDAVDKLVERFGGATVANAYGYWKNPENSQTVAERVFTVDVSMDDSEDARNAFIAIATHAAIQAQQHSVYLRFPSGEVRIPTVAPLLQEAA